jgi:prepilin-type N-terminal cleavage/methylation domain-containing protein
MQAMKYARNGRDRRAAFTLIELLIVIAIIGILLSITAAGVMKFITSANQTQTRTEIGQLETALAAAKADLGQGNPALCLPSKIVLHENLNDYSTTDQASYSYLVKIFGKRAMGFTTGGNGSGWIDWNGDGSQPAAGTAVTLYGQTALVFWLGGIPSTSGTTLGFSTSVTNPSASGGTRRGPYFEFKPNRMVADPTATGFYFYLDPYNKGTPFAYFTSYLGNDYANDNCTGIPGGIVHPYKGGTNSFINPNGVQILSAGVNGQWGLGDNWSPTTGYPTGDAGYDDQANFSQGQLGAGLN